MGLSMQPSGMSAMPGPMGKTLVGSVIGFVSSVFGIGGGSLSVPYFSWVQVSMKNAVATSAACGLPIEGALGFVYIPAFVGIVIASTVFAKMGARFAHQLPSDLLKKGFSVLLLVIGLRFVWRNASLMFLG